MKWKNYLICICFSVVIFCITDRANALVNVLSSPHMLKGDEIIIYSLDVGQGDCTLVKYPNNEFLLVDCGSVTPGFNVNNLNNTITNLTGGKEISDIVITHPHADHINIISSLDMAKNPKNVHISYTKSAYPYLQNWFSALPSTTKIWTYKNNYVENYGAPNPNFSHSPAMNIYILAANVDGDKNTHSIVLSINYERFAVMLTGDATAKTENFIMKEWSTYNLQSTVLSFGHHGSNHSSSKTFLQSVQPKIGLFSASAMDMVYGHPRCSVVDLVESMVDEGGRAGMAIKYHQIDCYKTEIKQYVTEKNNLGVFLTATQGNIQVTSDGLNYKVDVQRLGNS